MGLTEIESNDLLDRADEVALLEKAIQELGSPPTARVVQLVGDSGIGKTRLLHRFHELATAAGIPLLRGTCTQPGAEQPLELFADAIEGLSASRATDALAELDSASAALLAGVFPSLRAYVSGPRDDPCGARPPFVRHAVRELFERLAKPAGLVVTLDDLHWADASSSDVLDYLVRHPPHAPILLVAAYRPRQLTARLVTAFAQIEKAATTVITVPPLTRPSAEVMLAPELGRVRIADIYRSSGGNPLYLRVLAAYAEAESSSDRPALGDELGVPPPVAASLLGEFRSLSLDGQRLARAGAIVGDPFDPELAAEVAAVDLDKALMAIDELQAADVIRPLRARFSYRHPVLCRLVYESTDAGWRMAAHRRAAAALARRGADLPDQARQVHRIGRQGDRQGAELLARAAEQVLDRTPDSAARWWERAIDLLAGSDGDATTTRLELSVRLAEALARAGELRRSRDVLHRLLRTSSMPRAMRWDVVMLCSTVQRHLGLYEETRAMLMRELEPDDGRSVRARIGLMLELAQCGYMFSAQTDPRWSSGALDLARQLDDPMLLVRALTARADSLVTEGRIDLAIEHAKAAAAMLDSRTDGELTEHVLEVSALGWIEDLLDLTADALRHFSRGARIARETGQLHALARLLAGIVHARAQLGQLAAQEDVADLDEIVRRLDNDEIRRISLVCQALFAARSGDDAAALSLSEQVIELSGADSPMSRHAQIMAANARGKASPWYVQTILRIGGGPTLGNLYVMSRTWVYLGLASAELAHHRTAEARDWMHRAEAVSSGLGQRRMMAMAKLGRAMVTAVDAPVSAADLCREAGVDLETAGYPLDAAHAFLSAGIYFAEGDQDQDSALHFDHAWMLFQRCNAPRLQERVDQIRKRWARSSGPSSVTGLSTRERQIADLVSDGRTNRQIGTSLKLSPRTVETYLERIFAKLGVSSRSEVAATVARASTRSVDLGDQRVASP